MPPSVTSSTESLSVASEGPRCPGTVDRALVDMIRSTLPRGPRFAIGGDTEQIDELPAGEVAAVLRDLLGDIDGDYVDINVGGAAETLPLDAARLDVLAATGAGAGPGDDAQDRGPGFDATAKPIWEVIEEILGDVPEEELRKLPPDGAAEHDHYIYGLPKRGS